MCWEGRSFPLLSFSPPVSWTYVVAVAVVGGWGVEVSDGDCGGHDRPEGALRGARGGGQRVEQLHTGLLLKLVIEGDALVQLVKSLENTVYTV